MPVLGKKDHEQYRKDLEERDSKSSGRRKSGRSGDNAMAHVRQWFQLQDWDLRAV